MNQIIHDNKVYVEKENDFFGYWEEQKMNQAEPLPTWKGAKIDLLNWYQFVSYSLSTFEEHGAESMTLFFYDEDDKEWFLWSPPQETAGMTVKVTLGKEYDEQRKLLPPLMFGSGHHHCTTSAFQSGTDHGDEIEKEGIHVTLGNLDENILDIHARIIVRGVSYDIEPYEIIETPQWVQNIPFLDMKEEAATRFLGQRWNAEFPPLWTENIKKKTYTSTHKTSWDYLKKNPTTTPMTLTDGEITETATDWDMEKMTITEILKQIPEQGIIFLQLENIIEEALEACVMSFPDDMVDLMETILCDLEPEQLVHRNLVRSFFEGITMNDTQIVTLLKAVTDIYYTPTYRPI